MTKRLTDIEIAGRIVPAMLRWPANIAKTVAWDRLRECVDALRGLLFVVNANCLEAEQDQDLSPEGIIRRRSQIGQQALTELADFKPFQVAEKAVANNLAFLEERMVELPKPTTNSVEFLMEQEIRAYLNQEKSPINVVLKSMSDQRLVSAVLTAPPYLSGLSDTQWNMVRERARAALHPEQAEMQEWLKKALAEVREGMAAAKRILLERCEMREDGNGQFSAIRNTGKQPSHSAAA
jgi:hypothetical protein